MVRMNIQKAVCVEISCRVGEDTLPASGRYDENQKHSSQYNLAKP
jgi:hypothetical protein